MNEKSGAFTKREYRESARIAKCSFLLLLFSRARASEERKKRAQETSLDFLSLRYKIYEPRSFFSSSFLQPKGMVKEEEEEEICRRHRDR